MFPDEMTNPTLIDELRHDMITVFASFIDLWTAYDLEVFWDVLEAFAFDEENVNPEDNWLTDKSDSQIRSWAMKYLYGERYTVVPSISWPAEFLRQGEIAKRIRDEGLRLEEEEEYGLTSVTSHPDLHEPIKLERGRTTETVEDVLKAATHRIMRRHNATNPADILSYALDMIHELAQMTLERGRLEQ